MVVANCDGIDWPIVYTHPKCGITFWNKDDGNHRRAQSLADHTFAKEVLNLAFNLLSLVRIGSLCDTVGKRCARYEVDAVLDSTERWKSMRKLIG